MENPITQTIKIIAMLVIASIILGTIGALALAYKVLIAGAVCFFIAGILVGILLGVFISNLEEVE